MKDFPLPVRMVGPGSQPVEDEELQYLAMPRGMNTFRMPIVPERADAGGAGRGARSAGRVPRQARRPGIPRRQVRGPRLDLAGVSPPALEIVNQMLGEGEVSIQIVGRATRSGSRRACSPDCGASVRSMATAAWPATGSRRACCPASSRRWPREPGRDAPLRVDLARRRDELARAAGRDRQPDGDAVAGRFRACDQPDAVPDDSRRSHGARRRRCRSGRSR